MEYPRINDYCADVVDNGIASVETLSARGVTVVFCLERKGEWYTYRTRDNMSVMESTQTTKKRKRLCVTGGVWLALR